MWTKPLFFFSLSASVVAFVSCTLDPLEGTTAVASSSSSGGAGGTGAGGSGGAGGEGGGLVCDSTGVTKGPWTVQMKPDAITFRWEACRAGTDPSIALVKEGGGPTIMGMSTETQFVVPTTVAAPNNPLAPPDYAGTYYMHEAIVIGLDPATCYTYSLAADPMRKGRFCTSRNSGDSFKFMAIGDTNPGLGPDAGDILKHVLPLGPDFTVHCGDVQYYSAGIETWAYWFQVMQPMLSQGAFFPSIGNHENEKPGEIEDYELRFFGTAGFDGTNSYFRYQSGGVWYFALDTEEDDGPGSTQFDWFSKQLADAASQPGYRFSVVYFHRPFVTCGDTSESTSSRTAYEPLFMQYGVPLILQGHMHGYERFEINGLTYITAAGGGALLGNVDANLDRPECAMRVSSGAFHHGELFEVSAGQIQGTVIDNKGATRDSFTKAVP